MRTVTAADANRHFSKVLRDVAHGETVTIVSRGKPVAIICPSQPDSARRKLAKSSLMTRLRTQTIIGRRNWTRDELYDRES